MDVLFYLRYSSRYTIFPFFCSDFISETFFTIISAFGMETRYAFFADTFRISVMCGTNFSLSQGIPAAASADLSSFTYVFSF